MSTKDIADKLAAHCRKGAWEAAQRELYAAEARSIEQEPGPAFPQETRGLEAIVEKGKKWDAMVEKVHKITVSEPLVAGDAIALQIAMDLNMKGQGRMEVSEIAVYTVENGKITSERFFN